MTAGREGQQLDTLPVQCYGITSDGLVLKIKVNSSGELILSEKYVPYTGATQDVDLGSYDLTATDVKVAKLYLGDDGTVGGYNSWLQERPSSSTRRIMTYGLAQSGSFGTVISPTDTTGQDVYCNVWDRDFDNDSVTDGYYGGFQVDTSEEGNFRLLTGILGSSYTSGDVVISPDYWNKGDCATFKAVGSAGYMDIKTAIRHSSVTNEALTFTGTGFSLTGDYNGSSNSVVEHYAIPLYGISYVALGNPFYDTDVWIQGLYKTAMYYDWGNDEFQWYSNHLRYDNIKSYRGTGKDVVDYFDGTRWVFQAKNVGTNYAVMNTNGLVVGNNVLTYSSPSAMLRLDTTQDLNGTTANSTTNNYSMYNSLTMKNTADSSSAIGNWNVISFQSNYDMTSTGDGIRVCNNVFSCTDSASGDIATASITTSRFNYDSDYTGTIGTLNAFRVLLNGVGTSINMTNFNGLLIDPIDFDGTQNCGIQIGDVSSATANYAIKTGAGKLLFGDAIYFTQTDGNEFIDSLNDGYMDYGATTAHRFNADITSTGSGTFTDEITAGGATSGQSTIDKGLVVNDGGTGADATSDFRVETLSQASAFQVDASDDQINLNVVENYAWAMGDGSDDPTSDAPSDWIQVEIGGVTKYIPVYD